MQPTPAIWFPAIRTNTGTDVFTRRLVNGLHEQGIQAEITWLPLRAEYAPWTVPPPKVPSWATVVHINTWLHPRFIPRNLPLVATIHHAIHHPDTNNYKSWPRAAYHKYWIAPIERRIMQRADKVIAVSQFVANSARQSLIDVPMQVIHNGIDTKVFRPGNRVRSSKEPFRLLYVGSWKALKGVDLLAPIMRELGESFELLYTGGAAAENDKASMPPNMIDIGRLQGDATVAAAMQEADALLFPSRSEGHPLVGIEAMGCGLSVVAMDGSSLTEIIRHGVNGYLCERDNIQSFVETILTLKRNPDIKSNMTSRARTDTIESFSYKNFIKNYVNCYKSIT